MTDALREIEVRLTAPGAPFEIVEEPVLGVPMRVFRERLPSLRALLEHSAAHGDAEYLVCDDGRRITFAQHLRDVASVATALRDRFGVEPGDRVAILAANRPEWITSFWATVSLGAIAVGLNGWWVRDEILYGLADSDPKLLIGDRKRLARVAGARLAMPVVEIESEFAALAAHAQAAALPDQPIAEDDAATILYTSGTTGRPKGAVNTHRGIVAMVRLQVFHGARLMMMAAADATARGETLAPRAKPCMLVNAPLFHVSGLYAGAIAALANGLKSVWMVGRFDPKRVMDVLATEHVTSWGPMGNMMHRVLSHPDFSAYDFSHVTHLGSGGAPLPLDLFERMLRGFPSARRGIGIGYGLTESTALATIQAGDELLARPDSVGRPLPTVEVELRDVAGRPVADGEEGEVYIRGPLVMLEYWRHPKETAESISSDRWLRTGDVGHFDDGYLYIHSRRRDLILRGAENVYPGEIEQCLEFHPDVREAAVVGVDHPDLGQEVKAIVVVGDPAPMTEDLARFVADRLAYYKVPAHWELRTEPLPRNATGKVLKHLLSDGAVNPFVEE